MKISSLKSVLLFENMLPEIFSPMTFLLLISTALNAMYCKATSGGEGPLPVEGLEELSIGGLKSVLEGSGSPAFGATIIIIITVIVSGSAYLCFLKYVCAGCCKPMQVAPSGDSDPNKAEEQV